MATGVCARLIAEQLQQSNIERYFVAGLLHDIGCLVICLQGGRVGKRIARRGIQSPEPQRATERAVLGFDHTDVGRELLTMWRLPAPLVEIVASHHVPSRANRFPTEARVVHVSDVIVSAMDLGTSDELNIPPVADQTWESLELSIDYLPLSRCCSSRSTLSSQKRLVAFWDRSRAARYRAEPLARPDRRPMRLR